MPGGEAVRIPGMPGGEAVRIPGGSGGRVPPFKLQDAGLEFGICRT